MKKLTSFLLLVVMLLGMMTACHMDFDAKEVDWGEIKLGHLLPEPKSNLMAIVKNEEDELRVSIHHTTETDYFAYQDKCQNEYGFNGEISMRDGYFSAYHQESYCLTISYNNLLEEMEINLRYDPYYTEYKIQEDTTADTTLEPSETESVPGKSENNTEQPSTETIPSENNGIVMVLDSTAYVGKNYRDVEKALKELGFENVKLVESITTDAAKTDGEVTSVKIETEDFRVGDTFVKDVEITVVFLKISYTKDEIVFPKEGTKLAKDFDFKGKTTAYYINIEGKQNVPIVTKWREATVTDGVAEYLNYLESLGFEIIIENSSHREPYAGFDLYETDFKVIRGDFAWTMYLYIQDELHVEYELDIDLE